MSRSYSFFLLLFISQFSLAQNFKVSGKITNNKLEPLALVSIQVKDYRIGTVSKEDGTYELEFGEGSYDLIITMLGFKSRVINLTVTKNYTQNIILEPDEAKNLSELIIYVLSSLRSD
jgi:hypothetical protein